MSTGLEATNAQAGIVFAMAWIRDWNARDLDAILAHYADDVTFRGPKAELIVGQSLLTGKPALAAYWRAALARLTTLHFTLDRVIHDAAGAELVIVYTAELNGRRNRACELFRFAPSGLVVAGEALYGATVD